ncbi:hypothetical protein [Arthrobacter crystallopoietes]|uniref:hypothetical protein n=1 Tax=Crystallibacter crystallopoietes TaxID=37928 RepID=UPI0011111113|nr:hypothetical protein [Arthrobacter crystallopoietes]
MAQTLQIELEDTGGTSWWAGVLTTLASQTGNAYLRFVGRTEGKTLYQSDTFPSARSSPTTPPREDWAPGMTGSLEQLINDIEQDGWVRTGRGSEPWAYTYERPEHQA